MQNQYDYSERVNNIKNHNIILDVHNLSISKPAEMEQTINNIVGVVTNGLFARRGADILLIAGQNGVNKLS